MRSTRRSAFSWFPVSAVPRLAAGMLVCLALATAPARAQSEASAALSMLPVASVVGVGTSSVASSAAVLTGGAALTLTAVQASAAGTVVWLERASDGARVSLALTGRGVAHAVGTAVACSVIGTGVLLSVGGEVLAFVPNARGQTLLHHEPL